ncbi:MAG TPA: signal peptidase I [Acidimicrobiia bacterium]
MSDAHTRFPRPSEGHDKPSVADAAPVVDDEGEPEAPEETEETVVPEETEGTEQAEEQHRSFWRELPVLVLVALVIAVLIKTFIVQAFWIPSGSMQDTLEINDRVLVSKLSYRFGEVERGDVVVFDDPRGTANRESVMESVLRNLAESVGLSTPKSEFIKRIVALPGETIEIADGRVLVDGVPLDEPYVHPGSRMLDFGPEVIPAGRYFVMGDNRNRSQDSRSFGPIEEESVVGRAFVVLWPISRWTGL